jgi:hypothetical protein
MRLFLCLTLACILVTIPSPAARAGSECAERLKSLDLALAKDAESEGSRTWEVLISLAESRPNLPTFEPDGRRAKLFSLGDVRDAYRDLRRMLRPIQDDYYTSDGSKRGKAQAFLETLKEDEDFLKALAPAFAFAGALRDCAGLTSLGIPCDEMISRDQVERVLSSRNPASAGIIFSEIGRMAGLRLRTNPLLEITKGETTIVRLPLFRGSGFGTEGEWERYFDEVKAASEEFWRGPRFSLEIVDVTSQAPRKGIRVDCEKSLKTNSAVDFARLQFWKVPRPGGFERMKYFRARMAHEVGHILGFADRYYPFVDRSDCSVAYRQFPFDVMSSTMDPHISERDLTALWDAYGRTPSVNDNSLFERFLRLAPTPDQAMPRPGAPKLASPPASMNEEDALTWPRE